MALWDMNRGRFRAHVATEIERHMSISADTFVIGMSEVALCLILQLMGTWVYFHEWM